MRKRSPETIERDRIRKREWSKAKRAANPEKQRTIDRERMRAYRAANPEKARADWRSSHDKRREQRAEECRLWRLANPEKARASVERWRKCNPERVREAQKERRSRRLALDPVAVRSAERDRYLRWLSTHKDVARGHRKTWATKNPDSARRNLIVRRARLRSATGRFSWNSLKSLMESYHRLCVYCLRPAISADHITALARGGTNDIENIVPACVPCNSSKGDRPLLSWLARRAIAAVTPGAHITIEELDGEYEP